MARFAVNVQNNDAATEELVAASAGRKHFVQRLRLSAAATQVITIQHGAVTLLGPFYITANTPLDLPLQNVECTAGAAINVVLGNAVNTSIIIEGLTGE